MAVYPNLPGQTTAPAAYEGLDRIFVNGEWRERRSPKKIEDKDPFTGETLLSIQGASEDDLNEAYEAAREAQKGWIALLPGERAAILRRAADIMLARKAEIRDWLIREGGGVRMKAEMETQFAHDVTLEASSFPSRVEGKILPCDIPGKENRVYRKPIGVVGVISPWNFPLQLSSRSVAPALAVGNAVVLKPASDTAVTGGALLGKIYEEAGLPPGVLNVLPGSGSDIGDAFVSHPVPRVISFTGSTPVGRHIAELAAKASIMKKVALELGGNGPLVVLDDADLDLAVSAAVFGKFLNQGQVCMIINRILVDAKLHDEFVDRFVAKVRALPVGDPKDPKTVVGPVVNRKQLDSLLELIETARREGARQLVGGDPQGLVLPPHVFAGVKNDMQVAQHELFGPVATIIKVDGEEEALRLANDTDYGLSSAVFTRDLDRGTLFAMKIEAGMTHINDMPVADLPNSPFGGEKNSGIGRFGGEWAIEEFTTDHWITVQRGRREYPF